MTAEMHKACSAKCPSTSSHRRQGWGVTSQGERVNTHACLSHAVAVECVNESLKHMVDDGQVLLAVARSPFHFPKDPHMCKKWADQVKRTRDKWDGPTDHPVLYSCHLEEHCS